MDARAHFLSSFPQPAFTQTDGSFRKNFILCAHTQGASSSSSVGGGDDDGGLSIDSVLTDEVKKVLKGYTEWEFDVWKVCPCQPITACDQRFVL